MRFLEPASLTRRPGGVLIPYKLQSVSSATLICTHRVVVIIGRIRAPRRDFNNACVWINRRRRTRSGGLGFLAEH
jgi:hypothetical protein